MQISCFISLRAFHADILLYLLAGSSCRYLALSPYGLFMQISCFISLRAFHADILLYLLAGSLCRYLALSPCGLFMQISCFISLLAFHADILLYLLMVLHADILPYLLTGLYADILLYLLAGFSCRYLALFSCRLLRYIGPGIRLSFPQMQSPSGSMVLHPLTRLLLVAWSLVRYSSFRLVIIVHKVLLVFFYM